MFTNVLKYLKTVEVMDCPNLHADFEMKHGDWLKDWRQGEGYGLAVGYHYLGGHTGSPWPSLLTQNRWVSPVKASDDPALLVLTDLNVYYAFGKTLAPHTRGGRAFRDEAYLKTLDTGTLTPREV